MSKLCDGKQADAKFPYQFSSAGTPVWIVRGGDVKISSLTHPLGAAPNVFDQMLQGFRRQPISVVTDADYRKRGASVKMTTSVASAS